MLHLQYENIKTNPVNAPGARNHPKLAICRNTPHRQPPQRTRYTIRNRHQKTHRATQHRMSRPMVYMAQNQQPNPKP